jgi:hypothetical protein
LEVTENWTSAALDRFGDVDVAAVSPLVLDADRSTLVTAGVKWTAGGSRRVVADPRVMQGGSGRLRAGILGPTLAAAFYRRDVLHALGGFDATLDERYADVDLALAIAALDLRAVCETSSRLLQTAAAADNQRRAPFTRGRQAERVFCRHADARGRLASLVMHPFAWIGDALATRSPFGTLLAHIGRLVALLEVGSLRRYEQRLASARERLAEVAKRATIRLTPADRREAEAPAPPLRRAA